MPERCRSRRRRLPANLDGVNTDEGVGFVGFSKATFAFLRGLEKNNDKAWFDAHRDDYEAHLIEPAKAFVSAVGERLARKFPDVHAEPRVNGSIFRINRDVRFSKDKTPYKTHLDLWFWEGPEHSRSKDCPGYYFRLTPKQLILGAGMHGFDKDKLARYRANVANDARGAELAKVVNKLSKLEGVRIGNVGYKKVPSGYDASHPRAELLRHDALNATWEGAVPNEVFKPAFVGLCVKRFERLAPLMAWITAL